MNCPMKNDKGEGQPPEHRLTCGEEPAEASKQRTDKLSFTFQERQLWVAGQKQVGSLGSTSKLDAREGWLRLEGPSWTWCHVGMCSGRADRTG